MCFFQLQCQSVQKAEFLNYGNPDIPGQMLLLLSEWGCGMHCDS